MEWCLGGRRLEEALVELEEALLNYHGTLSENEVTGSSKVPEMPEALVLYKKCQALKLPLIEGGALDQPHIWLQEVAIIVKIEELFEAIQKTSNASE